MGVSHAQFIAKGKPPHLQRWNDRRVSHAQFIAEGKLPPLQRWNEWSGMLLCESDTQSRFHEVAKDTSREQPRWRRYPSTGLNWWAKTGCISDCNFVGNCEGWPENMKWTLSLAITITTCTLLYSPVNLQWTQHAMSWVRFLKIWGTSLAC